MVNTPESIYVLNNEGKVIQWSNRMASLTGYKKHHISNEVSVARDWVQEIDYIIGIGEHEGRKEIN